MEEWIMDEAMEKRWQELSEEVLSGMKEWRQSHPKATFQEIEQAVQERLSRLEAQMLQDVALPASNEIGVRRRRRRLDVRVEQPSASVPEPGSHPDPGAAARNPSSCALEATVGAQPASSLQGSR
jgi:hypothetical protein